MQKRPPLVALLVAGLSSASGIAFNDVQRSPSSQRDCCAVLELRQYTLKPGQRDALVELFDRHFIESQEAMGMTIVGQFRDRRRPDRFVWIRGFSDMPSRHAALTKFYGGPVWAEHKAAANTTMLDVNDVRLLKPSRPDTAFRIDVSSRPALGDKRSAVLVLAGIHRLRQPVDDAIVSRFMEQVISALRRDGVHVESVFVTESAPNTFTQLPVREGEYFLVWFGTSQQAVAAPAPRLQAASAAWASLGDGPPEVLELDPTPRSLLGHSPSSR